MERIPAAANSNGRIGDHNRIGSRRNDAFRGGCGCVKISSARSGTHGRRVRRQEQSTVHCSAMLVSSLFSDRPQALDLAGLFGVRFAYGHVGIFRWIGRFLDRKGLRLRRNPQLVFEGVHNIVMPDGEERKPPIFAAG